MNFPHIDVEIVPALPSLEVSLEVYGVKTSFVIISLFLSYNVMIFFDPGQYLQTKI